MLCYVYIIKSESTGRFYCGQSSDPERRCPATCPP
ncbi:MAG: GIY-YIG nuclease family protein [Deltaproteobacteria bacterium]|nr:GIY-YIG nuclease family protein [Deltaproteobacteria bacterium]